MVCGAAGVGHVTDVNWGWVGEGGGEGTCPSTTSFEEKRMSKRSRAVVRLLLRLLTKAPNHHQTQSYD